MRKPIECIKCSETVIFDEHLAALAARFTRRLNALYHAPPGQTTVCARVRRDLLSRTPTHSCRQGFPRRRLPADGSNREKATGIFDSSLARWRSALPSEHAYVGQIIAGKDLHDLGYQEEQIDASPTKVALIFLGFPFALLRGLYANRSKQGALAPYIAKRIASLVRPSSTA